ncbi:hypothetical protein Tco_1259676 [Tanacetum coccineum]
MNCYESPWNDMDLPNTILHSNKIKTSKPKSKGVMIQEPSETTTTTTKPSIFSKDKGKGIMVEDPLLMKKKDQIKFDEEVVRELEAKLKVEMEEEERAARLKEKEANIALTESWENTQAIIDANFELAISLQIQEQGELTIDEKSKLFVELMEKGNKHFAELRAPEKRNKPPTKAQKRNQMSTYLRHMGRFKHAHLKKVVEGSKKRAEESSAKRAGAELEQEVVKKQKIDNVQDEEEMKQHMDIVLDEEELVFDVVPLVTKPLVVVNYKIIKEGKIGYFQLIRADGSSKRYSSMI